jgi:uncharacterized membrane protein
VRRFARLKPALGPLFVLLLSVPAWLPWLAPDVNLWEVDDAKNHLIRLFHFQWLLAHGVWYPRWVPEMFLGYGYPLFNYYAPGFYYLALTLKVLLRLDLWDAFRSVGVFACLTGTLGAYILVRTVWRSVAGGTWRRLRSCTHRTSIRSTSTREGTCRKRSR